MSAYIIKDPTYPFNKHDWSQELETIYKTCKPNSGFNRWKQERNI